MNLFESKASDEAKKKGLKSVGFGRWANKAGKVVAKTQGDKLVMLKAPASSAKTAVKTTKSTKTVAKKSPAKSVKSSSSHSLLKQLNEKEHKILTQKILPKAQKNLALFDKQLQKAENKDDIINTALDIQTYGFPSIAIPGAFGEKLSVDNVTDAINDASADVAHAILKGKPTDKIYTTYAKIMLKRFAKEYGADQFSKEFGMALVQELMTTMVGGVEQKIRAFLKQNPHVASVKSTKSLSIPALKKATKLNPKKIPSTKDYSDITQGRIILDKATVKQNLANKNGKVTTTDTVDNIQDGAIFSSYTAVSRLLMNTYGNLPITNFGKIGAEVKQRLESEIPGKDYDELRDIMDWWKGEGQYNMSSRQKAKAYELIDDLIESMDLHVAGKSPIYRGMALKQGKEQQFLKKFTPGKAVELETVGFSGNIGTSTTFGIERARDRNRNVAVQFILEPTNNKIRGMETSGFGFAHEEEVIIPGAKYQVVSRKKVNVLDEKYSDGYTVTETHFITLKQL